MEDWIAGAMAVLGTLLVLAGGALIVLRTLGHLPQPASPEPLPAADAPTLPGVKPLGGPDAGEAVDPERDRDDRPWWRLSPANQLLAWGIVLLVLASLAAGLISFDVGLSTGAR
jgi:hypothetical protein